jgi:hypothetical protein
MDLEHGRLPDPFSDAIRLITEEQDRLADRLARLEQAQGVSHTVDETSEKNKEFEKDSD